MEYSKIDELERLAAQATPGPWDYDATGVFKWRFLLEKRHVCECMTEANAAYIVAMHETVPELIAEHRKLQERVRELERQTVVLASHLSKYVMHTMSTKEWLEWSEKAAKEAGNEQGKQAS